MRRPDLESGPCGPAAVYTHGKWQSSSVKALGRPLHSVVRPNSRKRKAWIVFPTFLCPASPMLCASFPPALAPLPRGLSGGVAAAALHATRPLRNASTVRMTPRSSARPLRRPIERIAGAVVRPDRDYWVGAGCDARRYRCAGTEGQSNSIPLS